MKHSNRHLKRIKDANYLWKQYQNLKGESEYVDIITDFLHLAHANGEKAEDLLRIAKDHFDTEQSEENDPENSMK